MHPRPRNRKQCVTDDTEECGDAPYSEHVLFVACRKASAFGDHIADILPPAGESARQPASRISNRKRDSRDHGEIEDENHGCGENTENESHETSNVRNDGRELTERLSLCESCRAACWRLRDAPHGDGIAMGRVLIIAHRSVPVRNWQTN